MDWTLPARLVAEHRDVLEDRPDLRSATPPAIEARGWGSFLAALTDAELTALEIGGHDAVWPAGAPPSLVALAERARAATAIAPLSLSPLLVSRPAAARPREKPRKRAQVDAFARLVLPLAGVATRIVDVGSGHGHLTRDLADRLALPVVGLERDVALASRARQLTATAPAAPAFAVTDVLRDGLSLSPGDLVVGLHACGELGDVMVESAARARASIALVGCCLQKRRALARAPLTESAVEVARDHLGLSNLTARDEGVEATREDNLAGRERRLALHRLLSSDAGEPLRLGAEIEGLNRRAAHGDLASLVRRAFALRSRPAPSPEAVASAGAWAREHHALLRRFSLPRGMLARVLEVMVLSDRARYLEARGFDVTVGTLFSPDVSARNLALVASPAQGTVTSTGVVEMVTNSL